MFCPSCGLEEKQSNQFCRACGADLRAVRFALEKSDNVTTSAATARDEIGRAIAAKIRETESTYDLKKVAEDVLPQIEKFLESPEEKRLRRMRSGTIVSASGLGAAIAFGLFSVLSDKAMLFPAVFGIAVFLIGLSFVINGLLFSIPKKSLSDKSPDAESQRELDVVKAQTNELKLPPADNVFPSVTEHTTQHLKEKQPIPRA